MNEGERKECGKKGTRGEVSVLKTFAGMCLITRTDIRSGSLMRFCGRNAGAGKKMGTLKKRSVCLGRPKNE